MVFSSLTFLYIFLPVTLVIYYIVPKQLRNLFILISGLFFYAWGEPIYVFVLIASTMIDYFAGLVIYKAGDRQALRKLALIVSMVMNLSLLGFFKYSNFIIENINNIFGTHYGSPTSLLPIGISFFTFQSMSYTIDLYRKNISVQKNPITFAAFVTLFPQIVAGPIVRYEDVAAELNERVIDIDLIWDGILRFAVGLGKKVLIAIISVLSGQMSKLWTYPSFRLQPHGLVLPLIPYRSILIFPVILIWRSVWVRCSVSISRKISIIRICRRVSVNSGADGI